MTGVAPPGSVPVDEVARALGLGAREHVALVGGGGKTTLLHALGRHLPGTCVLTTTTKMGADQHNGLPVLLDEPTPVGDAALGAAVAGSATGSVVIWGRRAGAKADGVDPERCDHWFRDVMGVDHVVVEADGSKRLPFKAPAPFEPVIPASATIVVSVIGADALGRVILDACHRPLRVAALAGCAPSVRLSPEAAARVLLHPRGFRASVPPHARFAVAITKVDDTVAEMVNELAAALAAGAGNRGAPDRLVLVARTRPPSSPGGGVRSHRQWPVP